jgi:2-phospho-L-lactate transferase/gluconeogenesis factor (CofD/UPF0052 family)
VPALQRYKAVEHLMMCTRAAEELERIADDIRSTLEHYRGIHSALSLAVKSVTCCAERALLKRKTFDMEQIMKGVWHVARKHLHEVESMPTLNETEVEALPEVVAVMLDSDEAEGCAIDSDLDCDSDEDLV